ncbi:uncharacterized protein LOC107175715 isoform X3 [Citrus sinensis]|nr:uncharacterized protein LOC107175715 isoform X3 [Citrus sinensis]
MHIEKNVCDSIVGTLLNIKGKSNDGLHSRMDLKELKIRKDLHPDVREKSTFLPPTPHTLSRVEKQIFCKRLLDLKLPDGYSSNIGSCISMEDCKISGLKSHDFHVLMQQLLHVALRGLLPKGPRNAIFRLCVFFNDLCQRVLDREKLEALEEDIVEIVCMFKRFFLPTFFDIMVHLPIHLRREARLRGPVQYRWMYPFEREMKKLKGYVRNRARPEGCIVKCYLADECISYFSRCIKQVADMDCHQRRNEEYMHDMILEGRPISKGSIIELTDERLESAHRYVLFNTAEVEPYLHLHLTELKHSDKRLSRNEGLLWKRHSEEFSSWFEQKIEEENKNDISMTLKCLACGPRRQAVSYNAYIINDQRYHIKDVEKSTQNSGVLIESVTVVNLVQKIQIVASIQLRIMVS